MKQLDEDTQRFYAALAARAEAEDYCPIEKVIAASNGTRTTAEELDSLVCELPNIAEAVTLNGRGRR